MITYTPFWKTLEQSDESWYTLTHKHDINPATLHRLKHDMPISTVTIDMFCRILNCKASDIMLKKRFEGEIDQVNQLIC